MFQKNNFLKGFIAFSCFIFAFLPSFVASQNISANLTFSLKSGPVFPVDANSCGTQLPTAHFIAIEAYNSSTTASVNVGTLTLDSLPTNWTIKGPIGGVNRIGYLSPGQRKTVYFYLRAKCATGGTAIKFRFKAANTSSYQYYRPSMTIESVITAAAGSALVSKISTARILGGYLKDTVTYTFSSFRTGYHMVYSPTSQVTFKYNSLNLESSEIISAAAGLGISAGTKDALYFTAGSNASGSTNYNLTVLYTWRIVGLNDTIVIAPFVCQEQGGSPGNIKGIRADTTLSTGKKIIVPLSANNISVTKTCASAKYSPGDTITFNIKLTNSGSTDIVVDEIRDTLPSGMSFVRLASGTDFTSNMLSLMPSGGATGALSFLAGVTDNSSGVVSMTVPGNSSKTLKIRAFIQSGTTGTLTNKSSAYISRTRLDTGYAFIQEFGSPTLTVQSQTNVTCNGGSNGQIKLTANSASRPFTWSKDGTTYQSDSTFSGLTAGTYTMYVKSNTGKISSISVSITQPSPTTITGTFNACVGNTTTLTGSGTAAASNPWISATTSVATVTSAGVVSGVAAGTSTITYTDANGCSTNQTITINALPTITGTASACVGATTTLTGSGTAAASNPWASATPSVATVDASGVVNGVSAGTSVITYTNNNGCSATQTVNINAIPSISGTANACIGATTTLIGSGTANASNPWVSASTSVATVSAVGVVTGVSAGTSVITYTNNNGCSINQTVTINALPTISGTASACVGSTTTLTGSGTAAALNPWVSASTSVATVSNAGVVSGVSAGTSVITYTNSNGCTVNQTVTINALPTISGTTNACIGATTILTGSGTAALANPWASATTSVATVSPTGTVTGVTAGNSTITYTDVNGCSSTQSVTINAIPTISGTANACIGATTTLTGSGTAAVTNPWVSATTSVATVNSSGVVTGVSAGTSVITYTNNNGCSVNQTVTINAIPTITGTANACIGATTTLTGSGTAATVNPWVSATTRARPRANFPET